MDREIQNFINGVNRKDAKAWERIYMDYYSPFVPLCDENFE